jgi:hypothetical protein
VVLSLARAAERVEAPAAAPGEYDVA